MDLIVTEAVAPFRGVNFVGCVR